MSTAIRPLHKPASQMSSQEMEELSYIPASRSSQPRLSEATVVQFLGANSGPRTKDPRGRDAQPAIDSRMSSWLKKQPAPVVSFKDQRV
mmetsp:Transcript_59395/g.158030  ORF Transcript_59395/g.158030 Transcript_59395/m.158030 type:complete len:89 (+) Transcript_59395:94-360(+)